MKRKPKAKFRVGQKVRLGNSRYTGVVTQVHIEISYTVKLSDGGLGLYRENHLTARERGGR